MSIEQNILNASKSEAVLMALEIIDTEIYAQILAIGLDPDTFPVNEEITIDYFGAFPENITSAEWLAHHAIPRLISKRIMMIEKLKEINNAGA